ncbi:MAG: DUF4334 domain-containing protein [Proteobacteria bacterium]|nr:DUF4334 domain-containing protein [Pseudomonadota bacterium]MBU1388253.1 DUF4334 domain-containing protein [Pseudomonadota bacterium]MBU1541858.1 DUF4334 domain-containing protein [Pseudomonadota bacterium]MBU2429416.1 DUF4334 domain-containing protein [Pseudomonadota bacterium]MBU2479621.1 DUF4334 domain-containing protein [Pseudomonadota bacterium]
MKFRLGVYMLTCFLVVGLLGCVASEQKKMSADNAQKAKAVAQIKEMIESKQAYTNEQILPLYDLLDTVDTEFMLGTWKGGKFDGGKMPDPINWYGKRFNSADDAEPLLARKPDGTIYSFDKWGMARIREVKFRGKVTGSLIYNEKPIMDYFRKLDENTMIGLGEAKGKLLFFFHLSRQNAEE